MAALSTDIRNAMLDALTAKFDGGTGRVNIYTGAPPASPATAATGTLLGTLTLASDSFAAAASGQASANGITSDTTADASGIAGWARLYNSDETAPGSAGGATDSRVDLTCGEGTGELQFDDADIVAGGTIAVSSLVLTMPAS